MGKKFNQLDDSVKVLLWHLPWDEMGKNQERLLHPEKGPYFYFRRSKSPLQERLIQLIDHSKIPRVMIHGSAHVDNYSKTKDAFGLVDFDRAYRGPYIWDVICLLMAIHLRNPEHHEQPLAPSIRETFQEYYLSHFLHPDQFYIPYKPLENITLKPWEENIEEYMKSNKKWAKQLSEAPIELSDPFATTLLHEFLAHHPRKKIFSDFEICNISFASGSFGRKRYLYLLKNKKGESIFLDIKETKNFLAAPWKHVQFYKNPYASDGERLFESTKIYAPDFLAYESYATLKGVDYWGREIPILNRKPNKTFCEEEQIDFAMAGGSQLGRGHRLSLYEASPEEFLQHFRLEYPRLIEITNLLLEEVLAVWGRYCEVYGN